MLSRFLDIERLIHSIKTVIACLLGLMLVKVIGIPAEQWVIITIVVVMCAQIYVGSVIQKAYLRFLGTLGGCLFAALSIFLFGDTNFAILLAITLSSFIFSYLAIQNENLTYAASLGAVTTVIIILDQHPSLSLALQRFLEISLGIFIATIVSQFILPIHASTHLRRAQANTLAKLRDYYQASLITHFNQAQERDYPELDEEIVKSLLKQRLLAKESKRERLGPAFSTDHFMQSLYAEREVLRAITFMHNALARDNTASTLFTQSYAAQIFNGSVLQTLDALIKAAGLNSAEPEPIHLPSIKAFKEELKKNTIVLLPDQMVYIDGFLFSADILTKSLATLANLYRVPLSP
jgi:uncharacterized membrane protein YccC